MSAYADCPHKRGPTNEIRHSKDDALDEREFELLLEGAAKMDDYYGDQASFVVLVLGRLGLRRGELCHLRESWIDWRQEMIQIPYHEPCHGERQGDGPCGYCRQLAEQRAEYNDDVTMDQALAERWQAKTPAASRDVYFGFDSRVKLYVERFFDRFDGWEWSSTAINRRVKKAAEHAKDMDRDDVRPHSLRATAATYHAGRGLEMHALMQHFGWAQASTAEVYLARNSHSTARQLDAVHQG